MRTGVKMRDELVLRISNGQKQLEKDVFIKTFAFRSI